MGTRGHLVYETPEGTYIMRNQKSDAYIGSPGLGKTLLDSFSEEKHIQEIFNLNMDFSTINDTKTRYEEKEAKSIKENGVKKHEEYQLASYDKVIFVNERAVKGINFFNNKKAEDLVFTTLEECLDVCIESYVYLYKQSSKSWFVQIEDDFLDLKSAYYIDKKYYDIAIYEENEADYYKMSAPNYLPKIVSAGSGPIPLDENKMNILEFKKNKTSDQLFNFIAKDPQKELKSKFFNELVDNPQRIEQLERMQEKYHLYLLNKKLHNNVQAKPLESKKLKI